jgi:GNAT superfamily N-acetyltransferase
MIRLATQHWAETQSYRHSQPFSPSFERYNQYAAAGWFIQFTAREEGRMVGYGGVYIVASMHTQSTIATEDTWYLLPEYRKGWTALRFFKFMEKTCRERGAVEVSLTAPVTTKTGKILEFLGYQEVASHYSKHL